LLLDHVDTDQIVPARFLKGTSKEGLDEVLFADWRSRPDFVLNDPQHEGARFLLSGENFGCGSSREHAPWALVGWGFQAILARSFADIFRNNALKNGLLPVELAADEHAHLVRAVQADPSLEIEVDLESNTVRIDGEAVARFEVDAFGRHCLLEGIDQLEYILGHQAAIARHEANNG
jgi:3-isopropylmalate/(R)-2-methylmalate dehydratase small subunit